MDLQSFSTGRHHVSIRVTTQKQADSGRSQTWGSNYCVAAPLIVTSYCLRKSFSWAVPGATYDQICIQAMVFQYPRHSEDMPRAGPDQTGFAVSRNPAGYYDAVMTGIRTTAKGMLDPTLSGMAWLDPVRATSHSHHV
ncbi:hypothetical protein PG999_010631 [Apiospora kogelbergensis]|uniref:Uncharacterized protein n=1 Tax=Apiospora kogelbergensis TaxID=1337665 RepID=A0AAW0QIE0_9PEZI